MVCLNCRLTSVMRHNPEFLSHFPFPNFLCNWLLNVAGLHLDRGCQTQSQRGPKLKRGSMLRAIILITSAKTICALCSCAHLLGIFSWLRVYSCLVLSFELWKLWWWSKAEHQWDDSYARSHSFSSEKKLLTQVCASKHAEHLSGRDGGVGAMFREWTMRTVRHQQSHTWI